MTIYLPKGTLISIEGIQLSEHNRSAAETGSEPIMIGERTVTGTMRRQHITNKVTLSLSWEMLPALDERTVDGFAGRNTLREIRDQMWLYNFSASEVSIQEQQIEYIEVDEETTNTVISTFDRTYMMFLDDYQETLVKRWESHFYNVSLSLVEA